MFPVSYTHLDVYKRQGLKYDYFSPNEKHRFNVFASAQHINRDSYYGGGQDLNAYGNTTDLNWMAGSQYVYSFGKCIFMPSDLTAGIEFNQDKMCIRDRITPYKESDPETGSLAGTMQPVLTINLSLTF